MKNKTLTIGKYLLVLVIGIAGGCIWGNVPFLTLDPSVSIADLASLGVTVFIAVTVTKILQSNQAITSYLVDELGELIELVRGVHRVIADAHSSGSFTPENRDALLFAFHKMELKLGSFDAQLSTAFPQKSVDLINALKTACFEYKNHLTDGELILSSCNQVTANCFKDCETQQSKVETVIKTTLQKIHRL